MRKVEPSFSRPYGNEEPVWSERRAHPVDIR
jgi:hypothetical protein